MKAIRIRAVLLVAVLAFAAVACAEEERKAFDVEGVRFWYRMPALSAPSNTVQGILVLFGGRNWSGEKTLAAYACDALADQHRLILLSPSFSAENYWEPQSGSGAQLNQALATVSARTGGKAAVPLYLYGYSAGGQCAALFATWLGSRVSAWGAHGCGVYPDTCAWEGVHAPALITCGMEDRERFEISRRAVYAYREAGGEMVWRYYAGRGHELNPEALHLARTWLDALIRKERVAWIGEDDTGRLVPAAWFQEIEPEFRNPLRTETLRMLWK